MPSLSTSSLFFQPGMVTTDLLMSGATTKQVHLGSYLCLLQVLYDLKRVNYLSFCSLQAKFFINVLAEPAEVVRSIFQAGIPVSFSR